MCPIGSFVGECYNYSEFTHIYRVNCHIDTEKSHGESDGSVGDCGWGEGGQGVQVMGRDGGRGRERKEEGKGEEDEDEGEEEGQGIFEGGLNVFRE